MIIECPNCNKKFEIDQNLLPNNGRLLQCGSCNHKWFFKFNIDKDKKKEEIEELLEENLKTNFLSKDISLKKKDNTEPEYNSEKENKVRKKINYLNILLVVIISLTALILILDTFKDSLTYLFPNIKFLLNNLYQSIEDVKLFIFDLIK